MTRNTKPNGQDNRLRALIAMKRQEYDPQPPACATCAHIRPQQGRAPKCAVGKFYVRPGGVCDRWVDRVTGIRLDV